MAENSAIEWTDHTFNPWVGCTKISPGCDHCYAEGWAKRTGRGELWSHVAERSRTSTANWRLPVKWNAKAQAEGRRYRVFCASLADVFDNAVPDEWRADLFALIRSTPHLDWLLLTKRIGNARTMIEQAMRDQGDEGDQHASWPWPNVWIGATIVNQEEADRDIPKLLATPARVRFLSMEPLLGPVNLGKWLWSCCGNPTTGAEYMGQREEICCGEPEPRDVLDWVIVGGESGPGARPMHPDWARSLRDQCAAAGVPFLFKQWGEWAPALAGMWFSPLDGMPQFPARAAGRDTHDFIGTGAGAVRVGKKAAGRLLDGVELNGFPA